MIKFLLCCVLISVTLTVLFASFNDSTVTTDLGDTQSQVQALVPPVFSITTVFNPLAWTTWFSACKTAVSYDYPNIFTGTAGTLLRTFLLVIQVIAIITVLALAIGMARGSIGVSWS
jgi:hypothetical protein